MYIKMHQNFQETFEKEEKESKKKKLKLIRLDRITPINHSEIKRHNKEYKEKVQKLTQEKVKLREELEEEKKPQTKPKLDNYFSRLVEELDKKKKEEAKKRQINLQRYKNIRNKYTGISLFSKLVGMKTSQTTDRALAKSVPNHEDVQFATQNLFGRRKRLGNAFLKGFDDLKNNYRKKRDQNMKDSRLYVSDWFSPSANISEI